MTNIIRKPRIYSFDEVEKILKEITERVEKVGSDYFKTHKELMYTPYNQAITDILGMLRGWKI